MDNCSISGTRQILANVTSTESPCDCYAGFTGDTCHDTLAYWSGLNWAMTLAVSLIHIICYLFLGLRITESIVERCIRNKERSKKRVKQSGIFQVALFAQFLALVALILRDVHAILQPGGRTLDYSTQEELWNVLTRTILNSAISSLLMMASSLVIGTWFDVAISKLHLKTAKVTRILCFIDAVLVLLLNTTGFIVLLVLRRNTSLVTLLVVSPLVLTVLVYMVLALILSIKTRPSVVFRLSHSLQTKQRFAARFITVLSLGWLLAVATGAAGGILSTTPRMGYTSATVLWIYLWLEQGIVLLLICLFSYRRPPWKLIRRVHYMCRTKQLPVPGGTTAPMTLTTTTSSNNVSGNEHADNTTTEL